MGPGDDGTDWKREEKAWEKVLGREMGAKLENECEAAKAFFCINIINRWW